MTMSDEQEAPVEVDVQEAIAEATSGLQAKNAELLKELKEVKKAAKQFEGLDVQELRDLKDKIAQDEELALISQGKHSEAWDRRLEKVAAKHQSELDRLMAEKDATTEALTQTEKRMRALVIDNNVIRAFVAEKGLETGIPDVELRASREASLEDGNLVFRDENSQIRVGKNGAMTAQEWVADLKGRAPHLFPSSQGAGATGSTKGGTGGGDTLQLMEQAAAVGDMEEYRRLHLKRKKEASDG
jgi:hypothetical protein